MDQQTYNPITAHRVNWRTDPDGMMRVTANVLKQGVFPYAVSNYGEQVPAEVKSIIGDRDTVHEFINLDALTDSVLATLEGKPVLADAHWWQTADDEDFTAEERESLKKGEGIRIGNIAGKPIRTGDFIQADFLIDHKKAIKRIQEHDLKDCSAGYVSIIHAESGEYAGQKYDVEQEITRFNHVATLKPGQGRCGPDVKILNSKGTERKDMHVIQKQVGNKVEKFSFENEQDVREAERMVDALLGIAEVQRKNAEDAAAEKDKANEDLKKENEALGSEKTDLEARLEALVVRMEKLAGLETREQEKDEEAIVAEELNSDDAEKVKEEAKKENSLDKRRKAIVCAVARENNVDASGWTQDAIDAQFSMLSAKARKTIQVRQNGRPRSSEIPAPKDGVKRKNAGDGSRLKRIAESRNK